MSKLPLASSTTPESWKPRRIWLPTRPEVVSMPTVADVGLTRKLLNSTLSAPVTSHAFPVPTPSEVITLVIAGLVHRTVDALAVDVIKPPRTTKLTLKRIFFIVIVSSSELSLCLALSQVLQLLLLLRKYTVPVFVRSRYIHHSNGRARNSAITCNYM